MRQEDIQHAIYDALAPLGWPVYDHVPQSAACPYIVVGEQESAPWDTDDSTGSESLLTVHVWSEYRGRLEAKRIQQAIYSTLHRAELWVSFSAFVMIDCEFQETVTESDGLTTHGIQRFRVIIEDLPAAILTSELGEELATESDTPLAA